MKQVVEELPVEATFKNKTLKLQYIESENAFKAYGEPVGKKYIQRINIIKSAKSIVELKSIRTLKCHKLEGKRKNEWSIWLTGNMRLIFTLHGEQLKIVRI